MLEVYHSSALPLHMSPRILSRSKHFGQDCRIVKIVNLRYHQYQLAHVCLPMIALRRCRDIEDTRMGQLASRARPITLAR